jgi:ubiquinol-cytochrome c reductase cytochrome c subunit
MIWLAATLVFAFQTSVTDAGKLLYVTRCSSCHGMQGQGSDLAPPLLRKSTSDIHFMLDTGRMPAPTLRGNDIHRSSSLTARQIALIVRYVQAFTPSNAAALPRIVPGDMARGRALFAENCAHCHGAVGDGASVGYQNVAPSVMHATALQIGEAIRSGPGGIMPRFGTDVLSDGDVSDIATYINYIQTKPKRGSSIDAGGISLSHVGPVAEGLVAWLFGIGLLVVFVRAIGEKTPPSETNKSG